MVRRTVIALAALLMAAAAPAAANGPLNFPFPRMHADSRAPGGLMDRHSGGAASLQLRDNKFLATMAKAKVAVKETIDLDKYPKLFGAGGFCAAITHFVTVPLDVVKTRPPGSPCPLHSQCPDRVSDAPPGPRKPGSACRTDTWLSETACSAHLPCKALGGCREMCSFSGRGNSSEKRARRVC